MYMCHPHPSRKPSPEAIRLVAHHQHPISGTVPKWHYYAEFASSSHHHQLPTPFRTLSISHTALPRTSHVIFHRRV
ncbi:hypothetical protein BDN70DRAFT_108619 [Pholiota conissans]|uniref:Uncharacterized protein n=1 Tax=Pholiota conissans TaxID=109636 RepID=A0A9P5YZQ5_9AGAR|nr:hypothetical protein BDN70DRAFT_108619 [Pholiota conissans]